VGLIALINYFFKYIQLDKDGLSVNCGLLSKINIGWPNIKSAIKTTYEKDNIQTAGGRVRFTVNQKEKKEAILLEFDQPVFKEFKNGKIQIFDNGLKMLLTAPPEEGLENLLSGINTYLNKDTSGSVQKQKNKRLNYLNIIIVAVSLVLIGINIKGFLIS
jgi:hypothetical protein